MSNINSFAENVNKIVSNASNQISLLNGIQESMIAENDTVNVNIQDSEGNEKNISIPSWNYLTKKVDAVSESVASIIKGEGVVKVGDGTGRTIKMTNIASVPERITGVPSPTRFGIDANWWFEDMMYPAAHVTVDLKGKIDDSADRVMVMRVILDLNSYESFYNTNLRGSVIAYDSLINLLSENNIGYAEDKEILDLPLSSVTIYGKFFIKDTEFIDGQQWYVLDTFEYKKIQESSDSQFINSTNLLKLGDKVSVDNFLYEIEDIKEDSNMVRLRCTVGYSMPQTGQYLNIYNEPWTQKLVNIKFSNNEINIVYFKGINEDFNIIANEWSEPIMFVTNELVYEGDGTTVFGSYYLNNIVDWGQEMIDAVKERKISAAQGITPNAPSLNSSDFSVVQINTQLNASMDSEEILSLKKDIETIKSQISSLKGTIEFQQTKKQSITDPVEYNNITKQINQNITDRKQLELNYSTSLSTMQSLLQENNAIEISPKYHVRGFFGIPAPVYNGNKAQQVIGFEIQYRYVKEDATGVDLKTYTYVDQSGTEHTGVFSDWNIIKSEVLDKVWNSANQRFEWSSNNISDGTSININQIDLPITKGEKLEFRVRSISEAGYPYAPLKSDWSNSVIIDFPSNLMSSSDISNLIKDINDDNVSNTVKSEIQSQGLTEHIDDAQANVNSVNNTYFKHQAKNISYEYKGTDGKIETISLQEALDRLFDKLNK